MAAAVVKNFCFSSTHPRTLDQQQQQLQAQMRIRAGAQNGLFGMNQAMQSSFAGGNLMDGRGSTQEGMKRLYKSF